MIGTVTHTAVMFPPASYPDVVYWPEVLKDYWCCQAVVPQWAILAAFDALKRKNRKIILESDIIRSVRFDGNRAFVVTFKKTDPLFAIDLANPTQPRITGELKIPGYSTYMHFMDESHLITIGYDAEDLGDFAWFSGIMLQVFDISDMSLPRLLHKEIIGTRGSTSDAATDHFAFNYFAPKDLLAIPITICEGGSGGTYGNELTFSGLMVYELTAADGFARRGGVPHVDPETAEISDLCRNWWTRSNSIVKRSIFMDDYVFSVAMDIIKVQHLDRLGEDVASITLDSP